MDVLIDQIPGNQGDLGVITLNRQTALNSLNPGMVKTMHDALQKWEHDSTIKAILIRANPGRAFCAGGDLRLVYQDAKSHHPGIADFFRDEYELNRCIYHYPKPYISFLDGITMGGGVGICIHGSHRLVTESTLFAMPETSIGFFPDIGGTYFLPRLSHHIGYYLGLAGARLKADDCVAFNIAQVKVRSDQLQSVFEELVVTPFLENAHLAVTNIFKKYAEKITPTFTEEEKKEIAHCFSKPSMEEIISTLEQSTLPLCQNAALLLLEKSPTSLKVTLEAFKRTAELTFDQVMRQEYVMARHFAESHDFIEGIRAIIIDKDQKPKWQPASLSAVTPADIAAYFST